MIKILSLVKKFVFLQSLTRGFDKQFARKALQYCPLTEIRQNSMKEDGAIMLSLEVYAISIEHSVQV